MNRNLLLACRSKKKAYGKQAVFCALFTINRISQRKHFFIPFVGFSVIKFCIGINGIRDTCVIQSVANKRGKCHLLGNGIMITIVVIPCHPCTNPCGDACFSLPCKSSVDFVLNQFFFCRRACSPELFFICFAGACGVKVPFCHKIAVVVSGYL